MFVSNKNILSVLLIILFFSFSTIVISQTNNTVDMSINLNIPAIALIDFVVDGNQIITYSYSYSSPNQKVQVITPTTGDKTWLNYSSIVQSGYTNYITAHISSGNLPADVSLIILIGDDVGTGKGLKGTSTNQIILSIFPQTIITNIGSCFTGRGINKGNQLIYVWENPESYNYSVNYENGNTIAVTYTISSTE